MSSLNKEPKYDKDFVTLGYLKNIILEESKELSSEVDKLPKSYSAIPLTPYYQNSILMYKGKIYKCKATRTIGNFNWDDWEVVATDDSSLNSFIENTYKLEQLEIQEQIDGKIETYHQEDDPSCEWTIDIIKSKHVGDYWYRTTDNTQWRYSSFGTNPITYGWKEIDVPLTVYDKIDSKKSIYTSKPSSYKENDLWIIEENLSDEDLPIGTEDNPIAKGDWVFSCQDSDTYDKNHWTKRDEDVDLNYLKEHYYTTEEINEKFEVLEQDVNSWITKAKDEINLGVSSTYTTKKETENIIKDYDEQIGSITQTQTTHSEEISALQIQNGEIELSVQETTKKINNQEIKINNLEEELENVETAVLYTWIMYADDGNGTNISSDSTGKSWIGIATNKETETASDEPSDYTWSKFEGPSGKDGQDGTDGQPGKDGQDGTNGTDGKSAYQIWLDAGNSGSEAEYLQSLKGEKGETGNIGPQGPPGQTGEPGVQGIPGENGLDGKDAAIQSDTEPEDTSYMWLDTNTNELKRYQDGSWVVVNDFSDIINDLNEQIETVQTDMSSLTTRADSIQASVTSIIEDGVTKVKNTTVEITSENGMVVGTTESGLNVQINASSSEAGMWIRDYEAILQKTTKDGTSTKDLELFGIFKYGKENIDDTPMFIAQLYTDENGESGFGHFYNGE